MENGSVDISIETLNRLLKRLGYSLPDYIKDIQNVDEFNVYYKIFYKAFNSLATEDEVRELLLYLETLKTVDNRCLCLYGTTKFLLPKKYPKIINEVDDDDINLLHDNLMKMTIPYSYYDLKLIADFAPLVLSPTELDQFYDNLMPLNPFDYFESKTDYTILVFKILNNMCDVAIQDNNLKKAKLILNEYEKYCKIFKEVRYNYYYKVAEASINYLETHDENYLLLLNKYAVVFSEIEDKDTAKFISKQAITLKENTYQSSEHIARDK